LRDMIDTGNSPAFPVAYDNLDRPAIPEHANVNETGLKISKDNSKQQPSCKWDTQVKNKEDTTSTNQSAPQRVAHGTWKSQNINLTMQYVEDTDGVPVGGDRAGVVMRYTRVV
jgi:hypothetical protein